MKQTLELETGEMEKQESDSQEEANLHNIYHSQRINQNSWVKQSDQVYLSQVNTKRQEKKDEINIDKLKTLNSGSIDTLNQKKQKNGNQKMDKNPQDLDDFVVEDEANQNLINIQDHRFTNQKWQQCNNLT